MARLFGRPETPGGLFITIAHGAQSALRAQNIDFVGHGLVPELWEGVRTRRTPATLDHHLVVISASISSGTGFCADEKSGGARTQHGGDDAAAAGVSG
jgi:hypothetical protein